MKQLKLNKLPDDVNYSISKQLIALPRGKELTLKEREEKRIRLWARLAPFEMAQTEIHFLLSSNPKQHRLRDKTLYNLALTSSPMSTFWSSQLRRHLNISFLPNEPFFEKVASDPEYLYSTRSLRIRYLKPGERMEWSEIIDRLIQLPHPLILPIYLEMAQTIEDRVKSKHSEKSVKANMTIGTSYYQAIWSVILDSMPNLDHFVADEYIRFLLVRKVMIKGRMESRPLRGLNNLKYLTFGKHVFCKASNVIWIMIFLKNLVRLQTQLHFTYEDQKLIEDHKEVMFGKSKITHLYLGFSFVKREEEGESFYSWEDGAEITQTFKDFFRITKNLIELRLAHFVTLSSPDALKMPLPSMTFLDGLENSYSSLQFLGLSGVFAEATRGYSRPKDPPALLTEFKNIKVLELDQGSVIAVSIPMAMYRETRPDFTFLPKKKIDFLVYERSKDYGLVSSHPSLNLMQLLQNSLQYKPFKQVLVRRLPTVEEANSEMLTERQMESWKRGKSDLVSYTQGIRQAIRFLRDDEILPYGNMPELENRPQ